MSVETDLAAARANLAAKIALMEAEITVSTMIDGTSVKLTEEMKSMYERLALLDAQISGTTPYFLRTRHRL